MTEEELFAIARFCITCGAQLTAVKDMHRRSSSGAILYKWMEKTCPAKCGEVLVNEGTLVWFPKHDE